MNIIDIKSKNSIGKTAKILKTGGVVVFPTDTVYGIGCLLNEKAIRKLYKIKNRSLSQPTAILITKKQQHQMRCSAFGSTNDIYNKFLNGKITIIMNKEKINFDIPKFLIKDDKVGIRIPNHKWLQKLIDIVGPIVASSANKKGEPAPKSFREISSEIIDKVDLAIKTSEKISGIPSKIIDIEKSSTLR